MIRAFIFDVDGVLVDSEMQKAEAWRRVLQTYCHPNGDQWYLARLGMGRKELCAEAVNTFRLPVTPEELSGQRKRAYLRIIKNETLPIEAAIQFAATIPPELQTAVASSTDRDIVNLHLSRIGLIDCFEAIVSGSDPAVIKNKPAPHIYKQAAYKLGVEDDECAVFEDTTVGVEAAITAGMICIGVRNQYYPNQDLSRAHRVIDDFSEITIDDVLKL